jgi:methyl-accepting chemotaxis protein
MHYTTSKDAALESADQISQIIAVIGDIADETSRIARNASLEAARAAEDGHNWALIAEEVRKLAERTTRATQEIAQTIAMLQGQINPADASLQATQPAAASVATFARTDTFADVIHLAQATRSHWIADWVKGRSARIDL